MDFSNSTRIRETLTCSEFIPRVTELEAQGGSFWIIKVLRHGVGYDIQCDLPVATPAHQTQLPWF
jgi:hypothetical protein